MSEPRWKFHVEGTFSRGGCPVFPCEAIIESGEYKAINEKYIGVSILPK